MKTFERKILPIKRRIDVALHNVALDAMRSGCGARDSLMGQAAKIYPGFEAIEFGGEDKPRMLMLNLSIPGACNARCPGICFVDAANHQPSADDLRFPQIEVILEQFKEMGGRLLRIVGEGEPTIRKDLPGLLEIARELKLETVIFTNGIVMSKEVLEQYAKGAVQFYVKCWSEDVELQNAMVQPYKPYVFSDGDVGLAPNVFYDLYAIDPARVGLEVMVSSRNIQDAERIIKGQKGGLPLFIESFVPVGAGKGNSELIPSSSITIVCTKDCNNPPRASYCGIINRSGQLQAGTFVTKGAVDIKGRTCRFNSQLVLVNI